MKKLYFIQLFAAAALLLSGCAEIDPAEEITPANDKPQTERLVSEEQARAFAQKAFGGLMKFDSNAPMTRAAADKGIAPEAEEVVTLYSGGVPALYIVNFAGGNGYMAISADKEQSNPMLMFSDEGRFERSMLEEGSPFAAYVNSKVSSIAATLSQPANTASDRYKKWEYLGGKTVNENGEKVETTIEFVPISSLGADVKLEAIERRKAEYPETKAYHEGSNGFQYVDPGAFSKIKWGQEKGYNADARVPNSDKVGCAALSVGQLCFYHKYPKIYDYSQIPYELEETTESTPLSRMLRDIGDKIPNYSWGSSGTAAQAVDILKALKTLGYTTSQLITYDFLRTYIQMRDGFPVLLTGSSNAAGEGYVEHIWNCNGYQEMAMQVTQATTFVGVVMKRDVWQEYADYIYMNWGWYGDGNTWVDQEDWRAEHPRVGNMIWAPKDVFYYLIPNAVPAQ